MARTGRPSSAIKRVDYKIRLLPAIGGKLDILCLDSFKGDTVIYGERTKHVEQALLEYFAKYYPDKPMNAG